MAVSSKASPFGCGLGLRPAIKKGQTAIVRSAPLIACSRSASLPGPPKGRSLSIRTRSSTPPGGGVAASPQTGGGDGNGAGTGGGSGGGSGGGGNGKSGGSGNPMGSWTILFGLAVGAGGLAGFLKKGSGKSLVAGFIFASALCFCGALMADPTNTLGVRLALVVVLMLGGFMGYKYKKTQKPFTAGIAAVSGLMTIGYLCNL
mmetsp:Transcript_16130/g.44955  ORF Transcript_16130/g.44955 Transcript_16130/m.44955 type:complete len:203 (-) Transcript_16130:101-709(-)|eukprot:CAMPEP_0117672014 /NCGR_PEP_ID=MMETSP0804-20121206/13667_1 /TAXON_ID=1074897 /ORGANISM="Tetraselmis astigmatica, Strain CCMP880" /LENGTH=202 /DNA_ID=CAMNT_0005480565 /DNA_START=91 /DNA_END=699 /DNA_ORIENTATION=+